MIEAGNEYNRPLLYSSERWWMEMVIVQVRDIYIIETGKLCEIEIDFGKMPPAAKIRRPRNPRIHQNSDVVRLTEKTGVTNHFYQHLSPSPESPKSIAGLCPS